jgi:hypothetical protein
MTTGNGGREEPVGNKRTGRRFSDGRGRKRGRRRREDGCGIVRSRWEKSVFNPLDCSVQFQERERGNKGRLTTVPEGE